VLSILSGLERAKDICGIPQEKPHPAVRSFPERKAKQGGVSSL